jgi:hypothetical protein
VVSNWNKVPIITSNMACNIPEKLPVGRLRFSATLGPSRGRGY